MIMVKIMVTVADDSYCDDDIGDHDQSHDHDHDHDYDHDYDHYENHGNTYDNENDDDEGHLNIIVLVNRVLNQLECRRASTALTSSRWWNSFHLRRKTLLKKYDSFHLRIFSSSKLRLLTDFHSGLTRPLNVQQKNFQNLIPEK